MARSYVAFALILLWSSVALGAGLGEQSTCTTARLIQIEHLENELTSLTRETGAAVDNTKIFQEEFLRADSVHRKSILQSIILTGGTLATGGLLGGSFATETALITLLNRTPLFLRPLWLSLLAGQGNNILRTNLKEAAGTGTAISIGPAIILKFSDSDDSWPGDYEPSPLGSLNLDTGEFIRYRRFIPHAPPPNVHDEFVVKKINDYNKRLHR